MQEGYHWRLVQGWPIPSSFSEEMSLRAHPPLRYLKGLIQQLTPEHLEYFLAVWISNSLKIGENPEITAMTYAVACEVLRFLLGDQWLLDNILRAHPTLPASKELENRRFLRTDETGRESWSRHYARVSRLGELLYNFQEVQGFESRIVQLRKSNLESVWGELDCLHLLARFGYNLRFIAPKTNSKKGENYEAEFETSCGQIVYCEVKSKSENTTPAFASVRSTISKAYRQLPEKKPGVVLLRIPESWVTGREIQEMIESAAQDVMRQSKRLVAVVLTWDSRAEVGDLWAFVYHHKCLIVTVRI